MHPVHALNNAIQALFGPLTQSEAKVKIDTRWCYQPSLYRHQAYVCTVFLGSRVIAQEADPDLEAAKNKAANSAVLELDRQYPGCLSRRK